MSPNFAFHSVWFLCTLLNLLFSLLEFNIVVIFLCPVSNSADECLRQHACDAKVAVSLQFRIILLPPEELDIIWIWRWNVFLKFFIVDIGIVQEKALNNHKEGTHRHEESLFLDNWCYRSWVDTQVWQHNQVDKKEIPNQLLDG